MNFLGANENDCQAGKSTACLKSLKIGFLYTLIPFSDIHLKLGSSILGEPE